MSDLGRGDVPIGSAMSSRPQNGGSRAAQTAGPTPTDPPRYRTPTDVIRPTDVMRERRAREARRQEEAERQRRLQEEAATTQEENNAGVGDIQEQRTSRTRPSQAATRTTQSYDIGGSGATSGRPVRQENVPPVGGDTRGSAQQQGQARASVPPQAAPQAYDIGGTRVSQDASSKQRARTEAYDTLNVPASTRLPTQQQTSSGAQQSGQAPPSERPRFPHAFERWETLSSHWEGLTSYWIRRLQENSNELGGKPIDQQMARQISDLSAAGANLFHAVVELQRLRASSERKFQRWFNEFRDEQEQSRERQAELEQLLREERHTKTQSSTSIDAVRAEKNKADDLVREMRRELQISKEEARRAWEELGRREQEERERTIALRSGEPTVIGGVQVVPMQGLPSRSVSTAQRPVTRDGPYPGGPGAAALGGQQFAPQAPSQSHTSLESPGDEQRQFTYRPASSSPAGTDPFTEQSGRQEVPLRHEPDTRFYTAPTRATLSATSAAAMTQTHNVPATASPARGQPIPTTNGTPERFYYQQATEAAPQPPFSSSTSGPSTAIHAPLRPGTGGTEPSYVPSVRSGNGSSLAEEEYHINPDGSWTLDRQGRRIPYRLPIGSSPQRQEQHQESDDEEEEEDYDPQAVMERERLYQQRYGSSQPIQSNSGNIPHTTSGNLPPANRPLFHEQVTATPTSEQPPNVEPDYSGEAYDQPEPQTGWENIQQMGTRHRHPTRLSDIVEIEERSGMTSPSRTSYAGGGRGSGVDVGEHAPALPTTSTGPSGLGLNVSSAQGRTR